MPRYIFTPEAVATGKDKKVTFYDRLVGGYPVTDLYRVNDDDYLTEGIPNGVIVANETTGLVGTFAGPDDFDKLYLSVNGNSSRTEVEAERSSAAQAAAGGGSGSAITHGIQITALNTGYTALYDTSLGRTLIESDLTVVPGAARPSDFTTAGGIIRGYHFQSDIRIDIPNVTFEGCLFESFVSSYLNGSETEPTQFNYCSWIPPEGVVPDLAIGTTGTNLYRCYISGASDALWINGGTQPQLITECFATVTMNTGTDHNDCAQNSGGAGIARISRCNFSVNPVGGKLPGGGGPNSVIMSADMNSGSHYRLELRDNYFDGGTTANGGGQAAETVRFYDGGLTTNISYLATGNIFKRGSSAPVGRGSSNVTPTNQVTWSNNTWDDNAEVIPLA
jgi:hypothetical protein